MRTRTHLPPLARRLLAGPAALMLGSLVLLPLAASETTPQAQNRGCLTRPPGFWASHPRSPRNTLSEGLGTLPQDRRTPVTPRRRSGTSARWGKMLPGWQGNHGRPGSSDSALRLT
jgi:hypothetical protein